MKTILIIVGLFVVLGLGWYFNVGNIQSTYGIGMKTEDQPSATPTPSTTPTPTPTQSGVSGSVNIEATVNSPAKVNVDMTTSGFSPSAINIKKGTTVVFKNMDTVARWPASNKHPTHLDYPGFDSRRGIAPGESYEFTFNEVKSIGMHDHLNPKLFGKINVAE